GLASAPKVARERMPKAFLASSARRAACLQALVATQAPPNCPAPALFLMPLAGSAVGSLALGFAPQTARDVVADDAGRTRQRRRYPALQWQRCPAMLRGRERL